MYVIIVYDVNVKRVNRVKKFLRVHLNWVQNSVFEGEVTRAELEVIRAGLRDIIDDEEDSVIVYRLRSQPFREVIGTEKNPLDGIM